MKKLFIFSLILMLITSCEAEKHYRDQETIYSVPGLLDIKVYEIDSCEYIGRMVGKSSDLLTHKGNCKYCINRLKK